MAIKVTRPQYGDRLTTRGFKTEDLPEDKWLKCTICKGTGQLKVSNDSQKQFMTTCPNLTCVGGTIKRKMIYTDDDGKTTELKE